jgi:hypothetical protein
MICRVPCGTGMLLRQEVFIQHKLLLLKAARGVCFSVAPSDSYLVPELCCIMSNGVELFITLVGVLTVVSCRVELVIC